MDVIGCAGQPGDLPPSGDVVSMEMVSSTCTIFFFSFSATSSMLPDMTRTVDHHGAFAGNCEVEDSPFRHTVDLVEFRLG
jgi:hypothetical protein